MSFFLIRLMTFVCSLFRNVTHTKLGREIAKVKYYEHLIYNNLQCDTDDLVSAQVVTSSVVVPLTSSVVIPETGVSERRKKQRRKRICNQGCRRKKCPICIVPQQFYFKTDFLVCVLCRDSCIPSILLVFFVMILMPKWCALRCVLPNRYSGQTPLSDHKGTW